MDTNELIRLVQETSIRLAEAGKGMAVVYNCYTDDEIVAKFGGKTPDEVVELVTLIEGVDKEVYDDILLSSGEYELDENGNPRLKYLSDEYELEDARGLNERVSSNYDYEHWNEEAAYIKAMEDGYASEHDDDRYDD